MDGRDYAVKKLAAIEKKYGVFFHTSQLTILDCVQIKGRELVSVHITHKLLPQEIQIEIDCIFWVD